MNYEGKHEAPENALDRSACLRPGNLGRWQHAGQDLYVDDATYAGDINGRCRAGRSDFAVVSLRRPESCGP